EPADNILERICVEPHELNSVLNEVCARRKQNRAEDHLLVCAVQRYRVERRAIHSAEARQAFLGKIVMEQVIGAMLVIHTNRFVEQNRELNPSKSQRRDGAKRIVRIDKLVLPVIGGCSGRAETTIEL